MPTQPRFLLSALVLLTFTTALPAQTPAAPNANALVNQLQAEILAPPTQNLNPPQSSLRGEMLEGVIHNPRAYPGTENVFEVYVPAEYTPSHPACLLLKLDGIGTYEASVLDKLIAAHQIPVTVAVGLRPAILWRDPPDTPHRRAYRFDRSYEFDSMNTRFPNFVLDELLPAVQKLKTRDGRPITLSPDGNDHAVMGASTGGIGSFTLAWQRPDQFTRVYSEIGTFVSMRGGNEYPVLVRKTDPKPIRIFLEDGTTDAWNPLFGSWYDANRNMESALAFAGYDVAYAWGHHGHDARPGQAILPGVLEWLWRGYPEPVRAGRSENSTLNEVTLPDAGWEQLPNMFDSASGLAADHAGRVYISDTAAKVLYLCADTANDPSAAEQPPFTCLPAKTGLALTALTVSQNNTIFAAEPMSSAILAITANANGQVSRVRTFAAGVSVASLTVGPGNTLLATEPGAHPDLPSRIWKWSADGTKALVDEGLSSATGVAFSPDRALFYAAESSTQWVYSYVADPVGTLNDKQPFDWLHTTDVPGNSGAEDLAVDADGNLYVASRMGVQICDQNGRVRAIFGLPAPSGAVRAISFGGPSFQYLYATDGHHLFRRHLKLAGVPPWSSPVSYPSIGAG